MFASFMCLTRDSNEISFCIKCPSNEVMNATVSIVFSREIVSAQYLCNVCIWVCECVSLVVLNLFLTTNVWETLSSLTDAISQCVQGQQLRKSSQLLGIPSDYSLLRNLAIFQKERCSCTLIGHVLELVLSEENSRPFSRKDFFFDSLG